MHKTSGLTSTILIAGIAMAAGFAGGALVVSSRVTKAAPMEQHIHDAVTTHGEWVKFANAKGDSVRAYVAYPERAGKAPSVILIHEIFGLTDWEPTMADRFAAKGYIAIAPDLLSSRYGMSPASSDSGRKLIATLNDAGVIADLDAAYKYVNGLKAAQKDNTGVIGFCWGGGNVWKYASANPKLKAAVVCYGPLSDTTMIKAIKAPVLGVFGQNDGRVTGMIPVEKAILGARFVADSYIGTGHGFLKPGRNGYGTPEYDRALKNIDAFFAKQLDHKK
jgi:carboxymethylenebutenolidase